MKGTEYFKIILMFFLIIPHLILYFCLPQKRKRMIKSDIYISNLHCGKHSIVYYLIIFPSFRTLFYYRVGKSSIFLKIFLPGEKLFFINTELDGYAYVLSHPYCTILNAKKIGHHFNCKHLTTVGNKQDGRNDLIPTIGNNVSLGANVSIIGDITIGDNVIIGAGSVVVKSIPSNCIVAGNPAKVIKYLK